jgi:hypothetical protein
MGISWREMQRRAEARRQADRSAGGASVAPQEVPQVAFIEPPSVSDGQCASSAFDAGSSSCGPV